jgi:hypothetical protein
MKTTRGGNVVNVTLRLRPETARLLEALASSDAVGDQHDGGLRKRVTDVLYHLAYSAAEGVQRPGAWERAWVEQAFGPGWQERLETDPQASWRQRPTESVSS